MKKKIIAAGAAVCAGLVIVGILAGSARKRMEKSAETGDFGVPELPVMSIMEGETEINQMYANLSETDPISERDSLTLLPSDGGLTVSIEAGDAKISSLGYEVRSLADDSFVENGVIGNLQEKDGVLSAAFTLNEPILLNQEYQLEFSLKTDAAESGETLYYDTRIIQRTGSDIDGYLQFAQQFCEDCLQKDKAEELAQYMTGDNTAESSRFDEVTLDSGADQVTWGSLQPVMFEKPHPRFTEISDTAAGVVMEYILKTEEDGDTDYYYVRDFYRMENNQGTVTITDLERRTKQIFDTDRADLYGSSGILLGVGSREDVEYVQSSDGNELAAAVDGNLYLFGKGGENRADCVFSFDMDRSEPSVRAEDSRHQIRICRVEDTGDITFLVYGYMAAGKHEGASGLCAFQYDAEHHALREKFFVPFAIRYEILNQRLAKLTYMNQNDQIYLYTGTSIVRIDTASGRTETIRKDILPDALMSSRLQRYAAWMNAEDAGEATRISLMDMETGNIRSVEASGEEKLCLIGFFNDDMVYGVMRDDDILTDVSGRAVPGIYKIEIEDPDGKTIKEYESSGKYVTGYTWADDDLELQLSVKSGEHYQQTSTDHIVYTSVQSREETEVSTISSGSAGRQRLLTFGMGSGTPASHRTKYYRNQEGKEGELDLPAVGKEAYFVYAEGSLLETDRTANTALQAASGAGGIVLDGKARYVYEQGNWKQTVTLDTSSLPQALMQPTVNVSDLQRALGDQYEVLDYTGCPTESIRYQISRGYAVAAKYSDTKTVLLVGYDIFDNLWYYDPETSEVTAIGKNDSAELFGSQGDVFLSYRKAE